jgi:prepilin-type N-terminal cleavage/methylation domain-containing protein
MARQVEAARSVRHGFTLAEVMVAVVLLAVIIPVALQAMGTASRAAELGQRKAAAARVAERVLDEQLTIVAPGQAIPDSANGIETDGDASYPWTMQTKTWAQDNMTQMTVKIKFTLQGATHEMEASTLYDPMAAIPGAATAATSRQ